MASKRFARQANSTDVVAQHQPKGGVPFRNATELSGKRAWRTLRAKYAAECKSRRARCWRCRQPIDYSAPPNTPNSFEPDHYVPVSVNPALALEISNLRPSHASCNRRRGNDAVSDEREWVQASWS